MPTAGSWPSAGDYSTAIQNPPNCFHDPELKTGRPRTDKRGLPIGVSGAFAVVYNVQTSKRDFAVRCFVHPVTNQQQRYNALSQHLSAFSLPSLVDFTYLPRGIWVSGQWYPIVRMEWVPGQHIHLYIENHLRDQQALRQLAAQWRGVVAGLSGAHTAHGDLQHGNILVDAQGRIRLVDYDAFFIPALRVQPPNEDGHSNYQHPQRLEKGGPYEGYYEENADAFSALVVYLSLLAVKADPPLWDFHNGENLIFLANDFTSPGQTPIWGRLRGISDAEVRRLTAELERFCRTPVSALPDLDTVAQGLPWQVQPPVAPKTGSPNLPVAPVAGSPVVPTTSPPILVVPIWAVELAHICWQLCDLTGQAVVELWLFFRAHVLPSPQHLLDSLRPWQLGLLAAAFATGSFVVPPAIIMVAVLIMLGVLIVGIETRWGREFQRAHLFVRLLAVAVYIAAAAGIILSLLSGSWFNFGLLLLCLLVGTAVGAVLH